MKTPEVGFSGTAGIIWVEGARMMHAKSGDGKQYAGMPVRFDGIADRETSVADRDRDRRCSIGRMIAERCDDRRHNDCHIRI